MKLGELSRRGRSRGSQPVRAQDKDLDVVEKLVPFGILEVQSGHPTIVFGTSRETSDFIVDCLQRWWSQRGAALDGIEELVINLDNGPELASGRTQFIKRMIEFADEIGLRIHLIYYPPYHSKYNSVERMWGILEQHWNGTLLIDRETAIQWAQSMTWKGNSPEVQVLDKTFPKGVKVGKKPFQELSKRLTRSETLPKWDVTIAPIRDCQLGQTSGTPI